LAAPTIRTRGLARASVCNLRRETQLDAKSSEAPAGTGASVSYEVRTFAAPGVGVVVNAQSEAASSVSRPFGLRMSEPFAVLESATSAGRTVPSTSE
jgi:hypothetical protein